MNELAKARAQQWAKLDVNKLWKRTEELLATHEKSASKMLSPSERTLLEALEGMLHERANQLDKSIEQQRKTIKIAEEEAMSADRAKELLTQYTERKDKEASFLPRIEKLLKDYQPTP